MGKIKECAKYNVISLRVTNEEKAAIDKIKRDSHKSVTVLMREAMIHYTSFTKEGTSR